MSNPSKQFGLKLAVAGALALTASPAFSNVFTEAQANAGQASYATQCAMCHGQELLGPNAPALVGTEVMQNFDTAQGLYGYIAAAMPPQAPGALDEEVYVNILAYILQANGAVAGSDELTADTAALSQIKLAQVTAGNGAAAPEATETEAPTESDVPQAYTWGQTLPSLIPAEPETSGEAGVPQAYTWGQTLPTVSN